MWLEKRQAAREKNNRAEGSQSSAFIHHLTMLNFNNFLQEEEEADDLFVCGTGQMVREMAGVFFYFYFFLYI